MKSVRLGVALAVSLVCAGLSSPGVAGAATGRSSASSFAGPTEPGGPPVAQSDPGPDSSVVVTTATDTLAAMYDVASLNDGETVLVGATDSASDTVDSGLVADVDLEAAIVSGTSVSTVAVPLPVGASVSSAYIGGAAVTALTNGDFAVLYWGSNASDGAAAGQGQGTNASLPDYYIQVFAPNGSVVGGLITIPDTGIEGNPAGWITPDPAHNGFVASVNTNDAAQIVVQRYANSGATSGSAFSFPGLDPYSDVVDSQGDIIVLFEDTSTGDPEYLFIPASATSTSSTGVLPEVSWPSGGEVATNPSGGFVAFSFAGSNLVSQTIPTSGTLSSATTLGAVGSIATDDNIWVVATLSSGGYALTLDPKSDGLTGYPATNQVIKVASLAAGGATVEGLTTSGGGPAQLGPYAVADGSGGIASYTDVSSTSSLSPAKYPLNASVTAVSYLDAGPMVTAGGSVTYTGGGSAVILDPGLDVTDPGSATLVGATVAISAGFLAGDALNFATQNGISGSYDSSSGVLTLSGSASVANYQTALESVGYGFGPSDGDPTGGGSGTGRTISWTASDATATSAAATSSVAVTHVAPSVAAGGSVGFVGGGSAVALDPTLAVSDVDSAGMLQGATVAITSGFLAGDALSADTTGTAITSAYNTSTGVLTLTGSDTIANYQAALDSVAYAFSPSNGDPTGGGGDTGRTVSWTVSDGSSSNGSSVAATSSLAVSHAAPVVTAGGSASYTGGGPAVTLDSGLAVTDVDSGGSLASATVTITSTFRGGDQLNFADQHGITGSYNSSTGVLTLSGTASVGNYQTALDSVTYSFSPSNADPTGGGSDPSRTISWTVSDGNTSHGSSTAATSSLAVSHGAPMVTAGGSVTYTGGGSAVILDPGLDVTDPGSATLVGATVAISAGFLAGDALNFATQNGISGSYDSSSGVLTLSGSASVANYQTALESVGYGFGPSDGDPTGGGSGTGRTISWTASDATATSAAATSSVAVTHVAPSVAAGGSVGFVGGGSAVALDPTLAVSDVDSAGMLQGATVAITSGFLAGDALSADTTGTAITSAYNTSTGVLTLTGSDTIANYQAALDSVAYAFGPSDGDPTGGGGDTGRTVSWTASDATATSAAATSSVAVTHVAPSVAAGGLVGFVGGGSAVALDPTLAVSDVDSAGMLQGATVAITSGLGAGDQLNFTAQHGIAGTYNSSSGVLTLSGSASVANYQAALDSVTYSLTPSNGDPTGGGSDTGRTVSWTVSDGSSSNGSSVAATSSLAVSHAAPVVTAGGSANYTGGGPAVTIDSGLAVTDVDSGGSLASATVTITSTFHAGDQLNFADQHGITGSYNSSTGVLTLSGTASVGNYQTALDSVTYSSTAGGPTDGGGDPSRTISWTVSDGSTSHGTSVAATSLLSLDGPPPGISGTVAGQTTTDEAAISPFAGTTVSDSDPGLTETVTITLSNRANGTLSDLGGGSYDAATGAYTISGSDSTVQGSVEALVFTPTAHQVVPGDTVSTVFTIDATAGGVSASDHTTSVIAAAVADGPTVIAGGTAGYTGGASVTLDGGVTLSDPDVGESIHGATVKITSGFLTGDELNFTDQHGITGSYDASTGMLTLSGTASIGDYQTALDSVTYSFVPSNADPTGGGSDTHRTIDWAATDGGATSPIATSTLSLLNAAAQLAFTSPVRSGAASTMASLGPVTVELEDQFGNPVTAGSAGMTVQLSSSTGGTAAFSAASGGSAITSVTIPNGASSATFFYGSTMAGTPTLTAAAPGLTSAVQQETITAGAPARLAFTLEPPSSVTAGSTWAPFAVTVEDAEGNIVTSGPGSGDAISLSPSPSTTSSGEAATAVDGVATFAVFAIDQAGVYVLTATDTTSGDTGLTAVTSTSTTVVSTPNGSLMPTPDGRGYWEVASDGGVFAFGDAGFFGSMGGTVLNRPIVGIASTPDGAGYWEVASDGGVFAFGDARFFGSMGGTVLNRPIVGIASTPDGAGYWEVASDGGVFAFGDAGFFGSIGGTVLNRPIVGIASTPDGAGYWEVASDGGVFAFGDARFFGSMGGTVLNRPIVGIASTPDGAGYWEVASDGGVFAFGDARFFGSMAGKPLNRPVVGVASTPDGAGYWEVASDGGVFAFGDAGFFGSMGGTVLNTPVVGQAGK